MITSRRRRVAGLMEVALATLAVATLPAAAQEPSVLTIARLGQFDTLDPPRENDDMSEQVVRQVYSTLLTYSYLERPYKLAPDLLETLPELAADKVTYTFRLRKGVRFHDNACFPGGKGRELTSDDVLYSIRRFADANINNKSWFAMEGAVVGLDAFRAATARAGAGVDPARTEVAGLHRIDATTFTIKLTHENPLFLFSLAIAPSAVVPIEAVQMYKDRFSVNPVGSGPFTLKEADRKGTLRFLKNPNYYRVYPSVGAPGDAEKGLLKDAGKKLPLVDVLEMPLIEEAQPAALKFLRGELDWRTLDRASFTKLVARGPGGSFRIVDAYASKFNIYSTPGLNLNYITLNQKDPLLGKNRALRQALAAALDPNAAIDVLLNGRGQRLQGLVPHDLPGSERETGETNGGHDVVAAKRLLAEAGYPGGKGLPPLTMTFAQTDADTRNMFDLFKAQYAAVGVQLMASFTDLPTYLKATTGGNFQMSYYGWYADYPDAQDFYALLYSRNAAPGPNSGAFSNPAYDQAYEASRYLADGPRRLEYFRTLNAIVRNEVPVIPVYETLRFGILQKWVGNFKRNLFASENAYISVDMALKKKGL